ncbi:MAG: alcohol dehydrogenase family protein [Hyphomicrobiales bacterium]
MGKLPDKMSAMVLIGHGGLDKLEYRKDWPTPQPGPGEVVVKVGACGLNNTDINTRTGWYAKSVTEGTTTEGGTEGFEKSEDEVGGWGAGGVQFPRIQGADVAGTIAAVGEGVSEGRIGERVMIDPWLLGPGDYMDNTTTGFFGSESDGGFAEYTKVPAVNAVALKSPLTDAELATFPCAYVTAENLIAHTGLKPGETVVITGASGGVGTAAIQLCRLRGAEIIAIAGAAKASIVKELGAHHVIDRNEEDLESAIVNAAGRNPEVALDVVGGPMFNPLISALRYGGRYSTSGAIGGPSVQFDLRDLMYKDLQMTGATIVPPGTMARIVRLIEQGELKPLLAQSFPLKELAEAQQAFMAKSHVGNIVVTI